MAYTRTGSDMPLHGGGDIATKIAARKLVVDRQTGERRWFIDSIYAGGWTPQNEFQSLISECMVEFGLIEVNAEASCDAFSIYSPTDQLDLSSYERARRIALQRMEKRDA